MATAPTTGAAMSAAVEQPTMDELARRDDPLSPLRLDSLRASDPFVSLLDPDDSVLMSKGGISQLAIYTELLRDDQVSATWGQRRLSLTSCDTVVEAGAEDALSKRAAEALQAEIERMPWDDITDKALFAVFYGWGVAEIVWRPAEPGSATPSVSFDRIIVRDRGRFRFDRDQGLHLWTSGSGWRQMPDRKFWTVRSGGDNHDALYGLGLAHALYWPCFFKRNGIKFWLIFLEKFGMPTAIAKLTEGQIENKETRAKAVAMLRSIATDAGVVVPRDDKGESIVELLEAARSGAVDYESMKAAMDAAISKIVVGQTMTTDNGSSRAQGEVHERVAQRIVEADSDLLCGSFNQGPVRWWTEWNFPGATPPRVYRHTEPEQDLDKRAERDTRIYALGYEPDEAYIEETYGKGWRKKQAPAMAPGMGPGGAFGTGPAGTADPAQFAEGEAAALQALRAARRGDQQALLEAAVAFAEQYQTIAGRQVVAVIQAAEESGDPELFRERLNEILAQGPSPEAVEKLTRAGMFSRLMGAFRAQRRA